MNTKNINYLLIIAIPVILSLSGTILASAKPAPKPYAVGAEGSTWKAQITSPCNAELNWISNPSLPTDVPKNPSNCDFQQHMWQSLFYLIQPSKTAPEAREFETWMPSYGIFVKDKQQPTPWGSIPKPSDCEVPKHLTNNFIFSNLTLQAGSHQPLIDQQLNDVYYTIAVNEPAYDFITGCDLYREQCGITLAPDLLEPTTKPVVNIPLKYPNLAFPDQSIELKNSWKVLTPDELTSNSFYTTYGSVKSPGKPCMENVALGLVGMHIVSKTPTHPEFIWATFEHKNNAPDCGNLSATPPLGGDWTFYDKDCTGDDCSTNEYHPGKATQVCRMHPWGDPVQGVFPNGLDCSSTPPPAYICDKDVQQYVIGPNTANLIAINQSVNNMLSSLPNNNVNKLWANYELVGNLWTQDGNLPPYLQSQRGSLSSANTTMETYVQNGEANVTNPNSCFSCHNLDGKTSTSSSLEGSMPVQLPPAGLSHIFNLIQKNTTGCNNGSSLPKTAACPTNIK